MSVNVSPRMFRRDDFAARMLQLAGSAGVEPGRLRIEINEASLLDDPVAVAAALQRLRDGGIEAILDDFGVGSSSLAFAQRFPLRLVKLDRAFLARYAGIPSGRGREVLAAVFDLARSLELEMLAEGVETEDQRGMLQGLGCRYGQGYLFGRARPL